MKDVSEAEALIFQALSPRSTERVPLAEAAGRVLRAPISADRPLPPYDRSTMDGIALSAASAGLPLEVEHTQMAGQPPTPLKNPATACHRIMTGAVVPVGADCVVPVEDVDEEPDGRLRVRNPEAVRPGQFVHVMGSDRTTGEELVPAGLQLQAPEIAVAAAVGLAELEVSSLPRVALLSTGDELIEPGLPIEAHQIRPSSTLAMEAVLTRLGAAPRRIHLADDRAAVRDGIEQALAECDVLISSGGVSKGDRDHLPDVLSELGVQPILHRIAQRPGKPMWFGVRGEQAVFALPGNPVSTLVCFARYVRPAIEHTMGLTPTTRLARLANEVTFAPPLTYFCPCRLRSCEDGVLEAVPHGTNTSGDFASLAGTDGFLELPPGRDHFSVGETFAFHRW